jgi:hypothetical protein
MSPSPTRFASIAEDGWTLVSAEVRHNEHPDSFRIPDRIERESLRTGDAAKLLFDIETREAGRAIDRGVDRLWVIVKRRAGIHYVGVLDSDPGIAQGLTLRPGTEVLFGPEHIIDLDHPPRSYVIDKYGPDFFAR